MACDNADCRTINAYPGWYSGDRWAFKPAGLISETGAGGVISCHTDYFDASHSVNSYEPEEYQQLVAEAEFEDAFEHNDGELGMFTWWILRDFNDNKYKASANPFHNGLNTKGLETYGGFKKDVYYLYRSFLRPNVPTIHITSKLYYLRRGSVSNGIKVYSNAESLTLSLNGKKVSTLGNGSYVQNDTNNSTADSTEVDNVFYWPVVLATGKNIVRASDSHGHSDSAVIYYYGSGAVPELKSLHQAISNLVSSNQANPAYYIDIPVQTQWPVYDDFDSTADNSLDTIPSQISGARWLALRRVTKPGQNTVVSFVAAKPLTVYVICTKAAAQPKWLLDSSFKEVVTEPFQWRGNDMILTDASLYAKHVTTGENVSLTLGERDALVLIKGD